jgi:hypothetical protein
MKKADQALKSIATSAAGRAGASNWNVGTDLGGKVFQIAEHNDVFVE